MKSPAAFGRLCVETVSSWALNFRLSQPPSGGCVLKQFLTNYKLLIIKPAAFGRLCVETNTTNSIEYDGRSAAFRRLCVETPSGIGRLGIIFQPPSGGCVLKL